MNNEFGLIPKDLTDICAVLAKYPEVKEGILFGSRAKGNYRTGSDVDLALKGEDLSSRIVADIADELNEETLMPYRFDVLNYHRIETPSLRAHIDRVGKCIYTADAKEVMR
ncbi:MAG: nucleotidyltransferase domain-containing protein [Bacteroidetes bacterium]|nr:nucleotidyltransferase domain-containing protein [Bacteroidota bacterium]